MSGIQDVCWNHRLHGLGLAVSGFPRQPVFPFILHMGLQHWKLLYVPKFISNIPFLELTLEESYDNPMPQGFKAYRAWDLG